MLALFYFFINHLGESERRLELEPWHFLHLKILRNSVFIGYLWTMEDQPTHNPHHVTPKQIAIIFIVLVLGLVVGFKLISLSEKRQARKHTRPSGLGHAVPQTFLVRETNGMVWIPSSGFYMGSTNGPAHQQPQHLVTLNGFWMDKTEVTVGQFKAFVEATGYITTREHQVTGANTGATWRTALRESQMNRPVTWVGWADAVAYARWAEKRLPTEAEWEYAARGSLDRKAWPWGNHFGPQTNQIENLKQSSESTLKPSGSYSGNLYGLLDMAGNVAEWCEDWYGQDYYQHSAKVNPRGPITGQQRVLRGASFLTSPIDLPLGVNSWRRFAMPEDASADVGFRCVRNMN